MEGFIVAWLYVVGAIPLASWLTEQGHGKVVVAMITIFWPIVIFLASAYWVGEEIFTNCDRKGPR